MKLPAFLGGIRGKLIGIFVLIKVVPLLLLAGFAWYATTQLGEDVSAKAGIYTGWREMDEYMRENKLETIAPQLPPPEGPGSKKKKKAQEAASESETKAESKTEAKTEAKAESEPKAEKH